MRIRALSSLGGPGGDHHALGPMGRSAGMWSFLFVALLLTSADIAQAQTGVLHITWRDNSTNEDGFLVERGLTEAMGFERIAVVRANTWWFRDSGLRLGDTYCYRVQAYNGAGMSGYSETVCGIAGPPPPIVTLSLNQAAFEPGDRLVLSAQLDPGAIPRSVDVYIGVLAPEGTLLSLQATGVRVGLAPAVRSLDVGPFAGEVFAHTFTGDEPSGEYIWFAGLTWPGTLDLIGLISVGPSFVFVGPD
jgi:hypothetical protein